MSPEGWKAGRARPADGSFIAKKCRSRRRLSKPALAGPVLAGPATSQPEPAAQRSSASSSAVVNSTRSGRPTSDRSVVRLIFISGFSSPSRMSYTQP